MMKQAMLLILLAMVLSTSVMAVVDPNPQERVNLQEIEYKTLLLEQHAKTQNLYRQELRKRDGEIKTYVDEQLEENFVVLDKRMNDFVRKASFKLGMVFVSGIVLGGSILLLISNQLRRKRAIKKKLTGLNEEMVLSGQTLTTIKAQTSDDPEDEEITRLKAELEKVQSKMKKEPPKKATSEAIRKKTYEPIPTPTTFAEQTIAPMGERE